MSRFEYSIEEDGPEMVAAERLDSIARSLERIADELEEDDE